MVGDSFVARVHGIDYCDKDTRGADCRCFKCRPPKERAEAEAVLDLYMAALEGKTA